MNPLAHLLGLPPSFLGGFFGSIAAEIILMYEACAGGENFPAQYKTVQFWIVRILVACVGGGLAYAYGIDDNLLLAANIGISAPTIVHSLRNGVRMPTSAD